MPYTSKRTPNFCILYSLRASMKKISFQKMFTYSPKMGFLMHKCNPNKSYTSTRKRHQNFTLLNVACLLNYSSKQEIQFKTDNHGKSYVCTKFSLEKKKGYWWSKPLTLEDLHSCNFSQVKWKVFEVSNRYCMTI